MSVKTTPTNIFIDLVAYVSPASSVHSSFAWVVDSTIYIVTECYTVSKITQPYNTYPCSIIPHKKRALANMHCRLLGPSSVNINIQSIAETWVSHDIYPYYGSLFSYHCFSSSDCITLGNFAQETIAGYSTTLVRLGAKVIENGTYFMCRDSYPPIITAPTRKASQLWLHW